MQRKTKLLLLASILCLSLLSVTILPSTVYAYPIPDLDAQGAILLEQNSGKILYAKNENQRFYPASTTKILTALIVLENC